MGNPSVHRRHPVAAVAGIGKGSDLTPDNLLHSGVLTHGLPNDTSPTCMYPSASSLLMRSGPPLSPLHESAPLRPAQIWLRTSMGTPLPRHRAWHRECRTTGISACRSTFDEVPVNCEIEEFRVHVFDLNDVCTYTVKFPLLKACIRPQPTADTFLPSRSPLRLSTSMAFSTLPLFASARQTVRTLRLVMTAASASRTMAMSLRYLPSLPRYPSW